MAKLLLLISLPILIQALQYSSLRSHPSAPSNAGDGPVRLGRDKDEKCIPLKSGDKVHLRSNLLGNHFITADEGSGDCGTPEKFRDLKHWTCTQLLLKEGMSMNSTFRILSESGEMGKPLVSGSMVKLVIDKTGKEVLINFSTMWPWPVSLQEKGNAIEIVNAHKIDLSESWKTMISAFGTVHHDPHAGEPICSGQQVFMRIFDERRSFQVDVDDKESLERLGNCRTSTFPCPYLYLQGDADKLVGFPHHFPGCSDPLSSNLQAWKYFEHWIYADDAEATSNTFSIISDETM